MQRRPGPSRALFRPPAAGAFTCFELLIVLFIMAILAAVAVPRFASANAHQRVDAAARRLAADLAWARRQALSASASQTVTFTPSLAKYELVGMKSTERSSQPCIVRLSQSPYEAAIQSADFGGKNEVIFNGFGTPDSGGTIVLQVGEWTRTVVLDPVTGEASIP